MSVTTSTGKVVADEIYDRVNAALSIGVYYPGSPPENLGADYCLFEDFTEDENQEWSTKSVSALDCVVMLQLWGNKARALMDYAKLIIDDLVDNGSPLSVAGFSQVEVWLERNHAIPTITNDERNAQHHRNPDERASEFGADHGVPHFCRAGGFDGG